MNVYRQSNGQWVLRIQQTPVSSVEYPRDSLLGLVWVWLELILGARRND